MLPAARFILASSLALLGGVSLLACGGSSAPHAPVASAEWSCSKVDPQLLSALEQQTRPAPLKVVVEMSRAPLARDLLQAGVADCVSDPALSGDGSPSGGLPWAEREMGLSRMPVMCVGYATREQIGRWCGDSVVRSVEPWN
jgi:hypothetical protein